MLHTKKYNVHFARYLRLCLVRLWFDRVLLVMHDHWIDLRRVHATVAFVGTKRRLKAWLKLILSTSAMKPGFCLKGLDRNCYFPGMAENWEHVGSAIGKSRTRMCPVAKCWLDCTLSQIHLQKGAPTTSSNRALLDKCICLGEVANIKDVQDVHTHTHTHTHTCTTLCGFFQPAWHSCAMDSLWRLWHPQACPEEACHGPTFAAWRFAFKTLSGKAEVAKDARKTMRLCLMACIFRQGISWTKIFNAFSTMLKVGHSR